MASCSLAPATLCATSSEREPSFIFSHCLRARATAAARSRNAISRPPRSSSISTVFPTTTASPSRKSAAATRPDTTEATVVATSGSMVPMKETTSGISANSTCATFTATGRSPHPWADAAPAAKSDAASAPPAATAAAFTHADKREPWNMPIFPEIQCSNNARSL